MELANVMPRLNDPLWTILIWGNLRELGRNSELVGPNINVTLT
jgi:hypothetical protein